MLVALCFEAAFQKVSRRALLHSIEQRDPDLAGVFSKWYTGATEHRMHFESSYTKITANSGVDQGCLLSTCGFSAAIDPVLRYVLADICKQLDSGAKLSAYLDDYLWIKLAVAKSRCGEHFVQTPFRKNTTRSNSHSDVLEDMFTSRVTSSPAPFSMVNRPPWRAVSTHCLHACGAQCRRTRRADCRRPPLFVCWCSQPTRAPHELCSGTRSQDV